MAQGQEGSANLLAPRLLMPSLQRPAFSVIFACLHLLLCGRRRGHLHSTHAHYTTSNRAAPPYAQAVALSLSVGAGVMLLGSHGLPLTTVLQWALLRPQWGPGT